MPASPARDRRRGVFPSGPRLRKRQIESLALVWQARPSAGSLVIILAHHQEGSMGKLVLRFGDANPSRVRRPESESKSK